MSRFLQMNLFFQSMAKGLSVDQINQILVEENASARRSSKSTRRTSTPARRPSSRLPRRILNSPLSPNESSEANGFPAAASEEVSFSNSSTESIASNSISDLSTDSVITSSISDNIAGNITAISEILQASDSEFEDEFEESEFDPNWYPYNADISESEYQDILLPDDVTQDIASDTVLPDSVTQNAESDVVPVRKRKRKKEGR